MRKMSNYWIGAASLSLLVAGTVHAQTPPPPAGGPPRLMVPASKDPAVAPPGAYRIDLEHSSVVARVSHRGMSFNVLRFGVRSGVLRWNAANPSAIALDVTVDAKPHYAPIIYTIPPEGPQSLDAAKYPDTRFVSTSVKVEGKGRATIQGQLTLMGVTKPAVINAELVGVGKSMEGAPTIGFTGSMTVDAADFTDKQPMAKMVGKVTIILDAEFMKTS
jgi:polyisoprenoid-binding protein YceI